MELHYTVAAQTDTGISKDINQDSLMVKVLNIQGIEAAFAVICDGMGGLEHGEIASGVVVRTFEQWYLKSFPTFLKKAQSMAELEKIWKELIEDCNMRIMDYSSQSKVPMGTTLTVLLLFNGLYFFSHVGDCRIYKMSNEIIQLTKDQTFVARQIELGYMTPEQAENDYRRNVLLQCIGTSKNVEPDFQYGEVKVNDTFLICSDGFRHKLSLKELYINCHKELLGFDWCVDNRYENTEKINFRLRELMELVKKRNETDNISAILVKVTDK